MEVVASEQAWKDSDTGELVFDHIGAILRQGSCYFSSRQYDRYAPIDVTKLHFQEIPEAFLYAPLPAGITRAPDPLPSATV
ncbi:Uu.00g133980.m01.CDS01 [Anthostomella pinea]|uniref:Uu.00g133980.m01.CDS01 n=1 Tax=Anthostomella pinea TaxID=933095 RepID=A0AAI8YKT2_9PEZI|nr:Uu.00g133980.m01.CDS01 [Anthostomella pinea]